MKINRKFDKLVSWGLWILIALLVLSLFKNIQKSRRVEQEVEKARQEVEKIKVDNETLEKQLTESQAESFIEKQIRDKLGLVKQGELVVVLPDKEIVKKFVPQVQEDLETVPDPNWKKWLKLFL